MFTSKKMTRKYILLFILLGLSCWQSPNLLAQQTCCSRFVAFASDKEFVNAHQTPLPYQYTGTAGKSITFITLDGQKANAFLIKAAHESDKFLFIFHEWWGLNDYVKNEAAWYAQSLKDVNVMAIDLYDGQVATTREQAAAYMQAVKSERAQKIIEGAMAFAGKKAKIVTLGWCFGGTWSLQAALQLGKKAKGCVMYYGMPETDTQKLKKLHCSVLGFFAAQDQWITPTVVHAFEARMDSVGKKYQTKIFEADHAFANPSNPHYNKPFTDECRKQSVAYITSKLKHLLEKNPQKAKAKKAMAASK